MSAIWLRSYFAASISGSIEAMAPCLASPFTQAPSRPTTSLSVPEAAPTTIWSWVAE